MTRTFNGQQWLITPHWCYRISGRLFIREEWVSCPFNARGEVKAWWTAREHDALQADYDATVADFEAGTGRR